MKNYRAVFACSPNTAEIEAFKIAKPQHVLLSWYPRWKTKSIKNDFIDKIGYKPQTIMLDPGAWSYRHQSVALRRSFYCLIEEILSADDDFSNIEPYSKTNYYKIGRWLADNWDLFGDRGKDSYATMQIQLFQRFYDFWLDNKGYINYVLSFDFIDVWQQETSGVSSSDDIFWVLKGMGMAPVPVFQYGKSRYLLDDLVKSSSIIALGGTAHLRPLERIAWAKTIIEKYPRIRFHMLGTLDRRILFALPSLYSSDGTAWNDKYGGRENKIERSVANINRLTKLSLKSFI